MSWKNKWKDKFKRKMKLFRTMPYERKVELSFYVFVFLCWLWLLMEN